MSRKQQPTRQQPQIELDDLLDGSPTWEQVAEFFKIGEFHEERYLVLAIEKHLQTEEQRKALFDARLSIEKMLNGRYTEDQEALVCGIYKAWNNKLGFPEFGANTFGDDAVFGD